MDANNANTGMAAKNIDFKWFHPTSAPHIEGVKISAPDYSIPPTPASSYSNLHVVLDTVHQSSETTTRSVMAPHSHFDARSMSSQPLPSSLPRSVPSSSPAPWSSPRSDPTPALRPSGLVQSSQPSDRDIPIRDNRLDNIPQESFKAVPEPIDPEQPGARSSESLTSLKSEIAPLPMSDPLAERTDRELPAAVDISLVDESEQRRPQHNSQWDTVGRDISDKKWKLKHFSELDRVQNEERQWRMSRPISPIWSGRWHNVGLEFVHNVEPLGFAGWLQKLKNKTADLVDSAKELASDAKEAINDAMTSAPSWTAPAYQPIMPLYGSESDAKLIDFTFKSQRVPSSILKMEEEERQWRMHTGVNPVLSGKWFQLGRELKSTVGPVGWANWLSNLKSRVAKRSANAVESIENAAIAAKDVASDAVLSVENAASGAAHSVEDAASNAVHSMEDAASNAAHSVGNAASSAVLSMENAAIAAKDMASDAIANNASAINSAIDSVEVAAADAVETLENAAIVAKDIAADSLNTAATIGASLARTGSDVLLDVMDSAKSALGTAAVMGSNMADSLADSAKEEYVHLTATKAPVDSMPSRGIEDAYADVDFTFKSWRTPAWVIAAEEEERQWRMSRPVNPILSGLWHKLGVELKYKFSLRPTFTSVANQAVAAVSDLAERASESLPSKEAIVEKTVDAVDVVQEKSKGWAGLFGSFAHSVAESTSNLVSAATHSHLVETAKDSLGMYQPNSIAALNKSEEAERVRRMSQKADPMMLARLGRVQDELLHSVKSV